MRAPELECLSLEGGRELTVVRDDLLPGGTKRRVIPQLLEGCEEAVYASPAEGFAQVALGHAAQDAGIRATVVVAARKNPHPNTILAAANGAQMIEVRPGYFSVVKARARDYAESAGARLLPFGLDSPAVIFAIAELAAKAVPEPPPEVWCVAGSGVLARALAAAWGSPLRCVQIGRRLLPGDVPEGSEIFVAPERFAQNARQPPPFPSCPNYDAKAWRFIRERAVDGALFWNVAA